MNVQELFRQLSFGELSNLSIGMEGAGDIVPAHHNRIIHYANQSLLRLYSRFVLKEADVAVELQEGRTQYKLSSRYALNNPTRDPSDPIYIIDSPSEPFKDDLIKVLSVWGLGAVQLILNDIEYRNSLFTPQPDVLQVPYPKPGTSLAVIYQAKHPPLPEDVLTTEIELPTVLEAALLAHIAHQVFGNMNGQDNAAKSADHLARYEMICTEVLERDLVSSSTSTSFPKLQERGFV